MSRSIGGLNPLEASMGLGGWDAYSDTNPHTGNWCALKVVGAANFSALTAANSTGMTGIALGDGFVIPGHITAFTLASGTVMAFKV